MRFYSTKNRNKFFSLREAVLRGLAPDGGLFMPEKIPKLTNSFFKSLPRLSFKEIAFEIAKKFLQNDVSEKKIRKIVNEAVNFKAPLRRLDKRICALELFHGPTLAFKDFGARFMARLMSRFVKNLDKELVVLTATSGDTGSAVARGFYRIPGIKVIVLYPRGKVSKIQEKQLTALGGNIIALEIKGSFDDCQRLVKTAFLDEEIKKKLFLTSANSINIARLIPQTFYYFWGYAQLIRKLKGENKKLKIACSVPSGNFGNLTAGIIAKKMGLPIKFIAATNANSVVPEYLETGRFKPQPSKKTISNAMDVGNPSNFQRMLALYKNDAGKIKKDVYGASFSDKETRDAIKEVFKKYNYILDPHGAVGFLGLQKYLENNPGSSGFFLETAHPAKFIEIVQPLVGKKIEIPKRLKSTICKPKKSILLSRNFKDLKKILIQLPL